VREQFRILLPDRYTVTSGVVIDSNGDNCGDCDLLLVNRFWTPLLKYGATNESRRLHIPVEAVYTVIEVKRRLTEDTLDKAMKKLDLYKGLERDRSEYGRPVENHVLEELDKPDSSLNHRFDVVLAIGCEVRLLITGKCTSHPWFWVSFLLCRSTRRCAVGATVSPIQYAVLLWLDAKEH
jgi:hypothetical protein